MQKRPVLSRNTFNQRESAITRMQQTAIIADEASHETRELYLDDLSINRTEYTQQLLDFFNREILCILHLPMEFSAILNHAEHPILLDKVIDFSHFASTDHFGGDPSIMQTMWVPLMPNVHVINIVAEAQPVSGDINAPEYYELYANVRVQFDNLFGENVATYPKCRFISLVRVAVSKLPNLPMLGMPIPANAPKAIKRACAPFKYGSCVFRFLPSVFTKNELPDYVSLKVYRESCQNVVVLSKEYSDLYDSIRAANYTVAQLNTLLESVRDVTRKNAIKIMHDPHVLAKRYDSQDLFYFKLSGSYKILLDLAKLAVEFQIMNEATTKFTNRIEEVLQNIDEGEYAHGFLNNDVLQLPQAAYNRDPERQNAKHYRPWTVADIADDDYLPGQIYSHYNIRDPNTAVEIASPHESDEYLPELLPVQDSNSPNYKSPKLNRTVASTYAPIGNIVLGSSRSRTRRQLDEIVQPSPGVPVANTMQIFRQPPQSPNRNPNVGGYGGYSGRKTRKNRRRRNNKCKTRRKSHAK